MSLRSDPRLMLSKKSDLLYLRTRPATVSARAHGQALAAHAAAAAAAAALAAAAAAAAVSGSEILSWSSIAFALSKS
jgi:hypothetical protein